MPDLKNEITRDYDVEHPEGMALPASILIDKNGIVQRQMVNNFPLGRNVGEMLRMIDALPFSEEDEEVGPAGRLKGEIGMKQKADSVASHLAADAEVL